MTFCKVERIPPWSDEIEQIGVYMDTRDFFVVYAEGVVSENGDKYYLIDPWIFEVFLPTMSNLINFAIKDTESGEKYSILVADIKKYIFGEESGRWQMRPDKPIAKEFKVSQETFSFLD